FHFDEHLSRAIAAALRHRGINVTLAVDIGLTGVDDAVQLAHAASTGRVMVTQDADYVQLHRKGVAHAGIAYSPQGLGSITAIIRALVEIHDEMTEVEMKNWLEYF